MRIACTDGTVAATVKSLLAKHGIVQGVTDVGPFIDDPTTWVVVNVAIDANRESTIRQEIERIAGATVHDERNA
jgi:hypothetical protein